MLTTYEQEKRDKLKATKPKVYNKVIRYEERFAKGESIAVIQLQYNYRCNMHCEHCAISELRGKSSRRVMIPSDVKNLCDQADEYGLAQIDFSGGEPIIFPDLQEVLEAMDTSRFYLMVDTNGWDMTQEKALWLRSLGVDKMQVSLDSFYPEEHDAFRRKVGSHERALKALDYIRNAGMKAQISTVITPGRIYTDEFSRFLALAKQKDAAINAIFAKPAGMWEGRDDLIISRDESRYISNIADEYEMLIHIRPIYGMNLGCLACKKIISINAFGDVMPCIWMYLSLGNIFDTPLRQILEKGMRIFKKYHPVCRTSEDKRFMKLYQKKTQGRELPIPIEEVFDGTDVE